MRVYLVPGLRVRTAMAGAQSSRVTYTPLHFTLRDIVIMYGALITPDFGVTAIILVVDSPLLGLAATRPPRSPSVRR